MLGVGAGVVANGGLMTSDIALDKFTITVKGSHGQDNSYKRKHFFRVGLQRISPLSAWWEAEWHTSRHGA